jgi:hypothetical protein
MEDAMTDERREGSDRSGFAGLRPVRVETEPYDATRDPRTGRPPSPLEAQHLARKHEKERLERENDDGSPAEPAAGSADNTSREVDPPAQKPAGMASPTPAEDELAAVDALVREGVARQQAEGLVKAHGCNWETLKAAVFAADNG